MSLTPLAQAIKDCFEPVQKYDVVDMPSFEGEHDQHENPFVDFEAQVTNDEIVKRLTASPDFCTKIADIIVASLAAGAADNNMFLTKDVEDYVYEMTANELMERLHF